jgi:dihydroflavonol-4-reductase
MRVFVTGGNGFIGSRVVSDLTAAGHQVVCLLREASKTERLHGIRYERVTGDVTDASSVLSGMRGCDATIHLAAPGGWTADDEATLDSVIVGGTTNVLAAAATLPQHRVVHVSSTAAVNASDEPHMFDERAEFTIQNPLLAYAHAKHRTELAVRDAVAAGLHVVIVNPAEVYGPNDTALGTAGNLIDFAKSFPVLVCSGGTSVVHVDDVSAGILAALTRGRAGERYILGGENVTIRQLAELVLQCMGRNVPIVTVPNTLARAGARIATRVGLTLPYNPHVVAYATRYWFMDNAKARRELGVQFRGARETVDSTLRWLGLGPRLS